MTTTQPNQDLLSRRNFLSAAAIAAGGAFMAPTLFIPKSARAQSQPANTPATYTLRAQKFRAAPDGREREIWGYNGQFPGPPIRVRENQTLRVKLINELDVPTSVHWHGMHQPGTWRMDGVEGVSAPPIAPGKEFEYEFRATPAGTHWYHSHTGVQYGDGLYGPLIVEELAPIAIYDREETLILSDWFLETGDQLLAQILAPKKMDMPEKMDMKDKKEMPGKMETPAKMEMPAMKMKDIADVPFQSGLFNGKGRAKGNTSAPLTTLAVRQGETIRLRLICATSTYAFRFKIDNHPLTIIASDGMPVTPLTVDELVLTNGERFDVLLKASNRGTHWIRTATLDNQESLAVLRYADSANALPDPAPGKWSAMVPPYMPVRSPAPVTLDNSPREIPLTLGGTMSPYRWTINDQQYPKADPIKIAHNEIVRFTLKNPTGMDHPFHLHGHSFHVLGEPGALNTINPPLKDTINVPSTKTVVIQWKANNPGHWFFHCHIEWHLATGMARVIEIE